MYFSTRLSWEGVAVTVIRPAFWFIIGSGAVICSLLLFKIAFNSASSFSQKSNLSVVFMRLLEPCDELSLWALDELLLELVEISDGVASTDAWVTAVPSLIEVI